MEKILIFKYIDVNVFFFVFLSLFFLSFSKIIIGKYALTKRLNNGNYIIISNTNITFTDGTMTQLIQNYNFENEIYSSQTDIVSTTVEQFSAEDDGYIIAIIKNTIYIFSKSGDSLLNMTTTFIKDTQSFSIIPYSHLSNEYYFCIAYADKNDDPSVSKYNLIILKKGIFFSGSNTLEIIEENSYLTTKENVETLNIEESIACKLMLYNDKKLINCIYGNHDFLLSSKFDPDNNFQIYDSLPNIYNTNGGQVYKMEVVPKERKYSICCSVRAGGNYGCLIYDITTNTFGEFNLISTSTCSSDQISLYAEYFYETGEILVGCKGYNINMEISKFSQDLTFQKLERIEKIVDKDSATIARINFVFPSNQNHYCIFVYAECETCSELEYLQDMGDKIIGEKINEFPIEDTAAITPLECSKYYNFEQNGCIETIPNGFYCNSTEKKTIDKCHGNCATCNSGPTLTNNNCETCIENKYFDLGNCVSESECINGYFIEDSINKCKCQTNITCKFCSIESKAVNLCITCNTGYYPKKNDFNNKDGFINCYNESTISDDYYLNINNNQYEPCHQNCLKCYGEGSDSDNKCIICKSGFSLIKNKNNIENCYSNCTYYYYFDGSNNYQCTSNFNCPEGYKLIDGKGKCIDNCINDNIYNYKYEYNNTCYEICPNDTDGSSTNSYLCELNCKKNNKYFNYEKTECISNIPDGYYCDNIEINTIGKCHNNCKKCTQGPSEDNNNCDICKDEDTIYFDLGNCTSNCINVFFINNNSVKTCKCTNNKKCYYCSKESIELGLCEQCNEGYFKKKDDETNHYPYINCYNNETIPENYYLNIITEEYEPCHENCKSCEEQGNNIENKCKECIPSFSFIINNNNIKNCYENCSKYYYFDKDNNYHCEDNCPNGYKLIYNTNKCINNCTDDNIYNHILEYNNVCYEICPIGTNISSDNPNLCEAKLICDNYYNYYHNACISDIPDGFYCNDKILKTIDKCDDNCKKCEEGPTENNNNCLECKESGAIYFNLGNCTDNCTYGYFEDEETPILKCKCSYNIKCKYCTEESIKFDLCVSCNNEDGYYPKYNETKSDGFINCYKNPEGFFLKNSFYYPCYKTCKYCNETGNENDNKCTECLSTHENKNDFDNDNNCYEKCNYSYYYDSNNKYHCTIEDKCPDGFNKLITPKKRCIENCTKDNLNYNYEYNNECLIQCPNGTHTNSDNPYKCIENLNCEQKGKYYNYEGTACIDYIPEGYYCNNPIQKTLSKCHKNCKTCKEGPNDFNNNCETCKDNGTIFYDLGNCSEKCENGFFLNDTIKICKCSTDVKCKFCDKESKEKHQCVICDYDKGFFPKNDDNHNIEPFFNCYKQPEGYYLEDQIYKPCYSTCKFCNSSGNETKNNCIECISDYENKNDFGDDHNCYQICSYFYYFDLDKKYHCTLDNKCPENFNKFIEPKKRCIDDCKKDNIYQYEYQNQCFKTCPSGTQKAINNDFLCEEIKQIIEEDKKECELWKEDLHLSSRKEISFEMINSLTVEYANKFGFSNNNVSKLENKNYNVYIYKNLTCVVKTLNEAPQVDFGECYEKVKGYLNLTDEELIITIINKKGNKNKNIKSSNMFYFSEPINGQIINITEICSEEKIVIMEDVKTLMDTLLEDKQEEYIIFLAKQGINALNSSNELYTDLCYHFESPNGRDVPMKDRISSFFPNITLCEEGCEIKGVDLEKMKAKCECTFNNLIKNNLMDNFYGQTIAEFMSVLSSFNIGVVQCFKDIFKKEHFAKCVGGFIILGLLLGKIICSIIYLFQGLYYIRKYIILLTDSFYRYMAKKNINNEPPRKKLKKKKSAYYILPKNDFPTLHNSSKIKISNQDSIKNSSKNVLNSKNKKFKIRKSKTTKEQLKTDDLQINSNEYMNKIENFLSPSFDENDFDDVLCKDHRKFCEFFLEKFKNNQIFINTFFIQEIFRPLALKFIILIMTIEFYFVINALFYNEEYLSELFNSKKKDTFFSFIYRRINDYIYISAANGIISYIIGYFFIEDTKLKRIFVRNKNEEMKLKYELSILINNIGKRFIILIFFSIFLSIIFFIYISCFNIVYPYIREEWIKSSIFIVILMQAINFCITLIETCFRYLAIRCNSKKFFTLSLLFS